MSALQSMMPPAKGSQEMLLQLLCCWQNGIKVSLDLKMLVEFYIYQLVVILKYCGGRIVSMYPLHLTTYENLHHCRVHAHEMIPNVS